MMVDPMKMKVNWNEIPAVACGNLCEKFKMYVKYYKLNTVDADDNFSLIDKFINDNKDLIKNLDSISLTRFTLYASILLSIEVNERNQCL